MIGVNLRSTYTEGQTDGPIAPGTEARPHTDADRKRRRNYYLRAHGCSFRVAQFSPFGAGYIARLRDMKL